MAVEIVQDLTQEQLEDKNLEIINYPENAKEDELRGLIGSGSVSDKFVAALLYILLETAVDDEYFENLEVIKNPTTREEEKLLELGDAVGEDFMVAALRQMLIVINWQKLQTGTAVPDPDGAVVTDALASVAKSVKLEVAADKSSTDFDTPLEEDEIKEALDSLGMPAWEKTSDKE